MFYSQKYCTSAVCLENETKMSKEACFNEKWVPSVSNQCLRWGSHVSVSQNKLVIQSLKKKQTLKTGDTSRKGVSSKLKVLTLDLDFIIQQQLVFILSKDFIFTISWLPWLQPLHQKSTLSSVSQQISKIQHKTYMLSCGVEKKQMFEKFCGHILRGNIP